MKPGDKVWVFNSEWNEIMEGTCLDIMRISIRTYVTIGYSTPSGSIIRSGGNLLNRDCFASREALCKFYRKIFE